MLKAKKTNRYLILISASVVIFLAAFCFLFQPVQAGGGSGYDLVDAVNNYRAQNGLYALNADAKVMAAAQAHAEWIVETGNGGHTGAGGSDETIRVMWAGYGNGASIHCDEAWASTSSIESAVYSAWADWIHQAVMLDYWANGYTDAGGGVADNGNGTYVFVFDICVVSGKSAANAPTAVNTLVNDELGYVIEPTADLSQFIMSVKLADSAADGSITHVVDYGQTLVQIALAYGVKVADIRQLNGMAEDDTLIYPEQKLLIKAGGKQAASTQAVSGSTAQGDQASTITLSPSFTPRVRPSRTPTEVTASATVIAKEGQVEQQPDNTSAVGWIIGMVFVIGLAAFLLFSGKKG